MTETTHGMVTPIKLIPAGLAIVASTYGLSRYTYGLFVPEIQAAFDLTTASMGLIGSASYLAYLAATLFGSTVSGVLGPRLPVVLGGLAAAGGMALIALAPNTWVLVLGIMLAGTSPGLAYPPLSDAVMQLIAEPQQNRTYAVINSGTSVGVIIAGPAALLAADDWRLAWAAFALFAAAATAWNASLMPSHGRAAAQQKAQTPQRLRWRWLVGEKSHRLFAAATAFGLVSAVYWTFAVDLLGKTGSLPAGGSRVFWIAIGVAGLLGGAAGDLTRRIGLRTTFRCALVGIAAAIAALAIWPSWQPAVYASGLLFGGTFILITGLFGIWSVNVFQERPSAGFGATFFLISAGQLVGPAAAGLAADRIGLPATFLISAAACCAIIAVGPRRDLFSMARTSSA